MRLRYVVAALPLALGACGDDGGDESPDAEQVDAEVADAAPPDAIPEGPVTVTVTAEGNPIPGIDVVFNNPDGSVNGVEQTGSGGQASRDLQIGGSATIVVSPDGGTSYVGITFAAVEPGDQLAFEFEPPAPTDVGNFSATLPVGVIAGATQYEVSLGCASSFTSTPAIPVTGDIFSDCLGTDQTIDAFVTALDNAGTPLAYDYVKDVAVVIGGGTTNLVFDAWQQTSVPLAITLNNVPASIPGVGYEAHWRVDGIDFGGFGGGGDAPTGGTITVNSSYPTGSFVERLQYGLFYGYGNQPTDGIGILIAGHPDAPVTATHDLGALALPEITEAAAEATAGRVSLEWTASGSLSSTDGALVVMSWADVAPGMITDQWYAVLPPGATSPYVMPEMPDDVAGFVPVAATTFEVPTVIFGEADYIDGYDAWRSGEGLIIFGDNAFDNMPATGGLFRATLGGNL